MDNWHPRIAREKTTIEKMVYIFCHEKHGTPKNSLCPDCQALIDYATERLRNCPFHEKKSTCAKCTVHCYKPIMREKIRVVMRFAGPKMLLYHPYLAIMHLAVDSRHKPPLLERKSKHQKVEKSKG